MTKAQLKKAADRAQGEMFAAYDAMKFAGCKDGWTESDTITYDALSDKHDAAVMRFIDARSTYFFTA